MEKVFNKKLKRLIDSHSVISFDIFDTLIKRNCYNPKDVFSLVEMVFNKTSEKKIDNFFCKRIDAEEKARIFYKNNEDINLNQIYEFIDMDIELKEKIKQIEINTELNICQRNHNIFEVYKYCRDNGKTIICTSDMYLDLKTISMILKNADLNVDKIYVSSEIKKTKLTGNVFDYVIKDLKISNKDLLHIGDSWKADYLSPLRKGIKAYHIKKKNNNFSYVKSSVNEKTELSNNIILSFINNNTVLIDDEYKKIGFEIVGPLCLDFCYWLNNKVKESSIDNLLFCARDMEMIQKIFNLLFGESINNSYFYVSRKSTYLPYLYVNNKYKNFCDLIPAGRRKLTIQELLDLYNIKIDSDYLKVELPKYGFNLDVKYDFDSIKNDNNLEKLYNEIILKEIITVGKVQYNNFIRYLKSIGCDENTAIVDLGWRGTTQNIMIDILKKPLYGYYFGLHSLNGDNLHKNYDTYLFYKQANGYSDKIYSCMSLCELILSALHGSTVSYTDNTDCPYVLDYSANEDNSFIRNIQDGAVEFCLRIKKYKEYLCMSNDKIFADNFINIGINPNYVQAKNLGNIYTENIKTRRLCEYKNLFYYMYHLKILKNDFIDSEWKIGFMKNVLKIKLPYYKIYTFIKKKFK